MDVPAVGSGARTHALSARARRIAYGVYYLMTPRLRRRLIRLALAHYTVGAVAVVRDAEQPGRVVLLRHPRSVGWGLPAGLLKRGERPVDGCARELAEETGLRVPAEEFSPAVPNAVVHHVGAWVDMVFEASVPSSAVTFHADGAEVVEVAWHRLDSLPPLAPGTARLFAHYGVGPLASYPEVRS